MKWRWPQRAEHWSEELRDEAREHVGDSPRLRIAVVALVLLAVALLALGVYWSREPAPFDVAVNLRETLRDGGATPAAGVVTAGTLAQVASTLLDKSGGFVNNDIAPPGVWLDNMAGWERGALQQVRDMARSLRDDFGRPAGAAEPDEDLAHAEPRFNFSDHSWMLPTSESKYRDARDYVRDYQARLQQGGEAAHFVATADTLDRYLARVTARLDSLVQRLSACVPRENLLLPANVPVSEPRALTPSSRIDDVFYEARGSAWALLHMLRAVEIDFAAVLREKSAHDELREAIRNLDATQDAIYSPVILNGSGFGLVANHSLVMASYMARADTAVANVRRLLIETAPAPGAAKADEQVDEHLTIEQESNP